ncbi:MAG: hypothetical protein AB7N70_00080 [Dehalococcoidia bacterium]
MRPLRWPVLVVLLSVVIVACDRGRKPAPAADAPHAEPPAIVPAATTTASATIADPRFRPLPGARADFGTYNGGAYRIEVPLQWNGVLVLYAHGYRGDTPEVWVSDSPIRPHLIENGYAWAASSYRQNGYRPDIGLEDTLALKSLFVERYGEPRLTILEGSSMGGHVLAAAMELHQVEFQGALAECPAIGIGVVDYLLAFGAAAEFVSGVDLFDAPDAPSFVRTALSEWLPAVGAGSVPTEKGRAFQSVAKYLMGGALPFWQEGLAERTTRAANLLLLADPNRMATPAGRAADTRHVQYRIDPGLGFTAEEINQGTRRFAPAPGSRLVSDNAVFAELTGRIVAPVITLHTTGDAYVPFALEQDYRRLTIAAGTADYLVQRAIRRPGHCQFEAPEVTRAFDDLMRWVEHGDRPEGDDVLTPDLQSLGLKWTTPLLPTDPARP